MIPLARPSIGAREEELVLDTLRSGRLALGPRLASFEASFAAASGGSHVSAVSSGTAGLHLAIRATAGVDVVDPAGPALGIEGDLARHRMGNEGELPRRHRR